MTANKPTLNTPTNQSSSINLALNSRWRFFKSRSGDILAKTYASDALTHLSGFIEISAAEYARLEQEQKL